MRKNLIPATLLVPIIMAALLACTGATPTPDPTETLEHAGITAATPATPNTREPTATTTPPPTITQVPPGTPSLLSTMDQEAVISSLSENELACIDQDPERMVAALTGGAPASMDEQAKLIGCLDDDTVDLFFMATIIPVPLSIDTTNCVRAGLEVIDPRAVMTAGLAGDPETAMGGSVTAFTIMLACLNHEEWATAAPRLGMEPADRDGMVCVMAVLGGPAEMATAMTEAMAAEAVARESALFAAGLECGMETPPEPVAPEPGTPTPTPTPAATIAAVAPTTEPAKETPTPTTVPSTPAPTPTNTLVITVAAIPEDIPDYDRDDWRHWVDADGDCQDARQEVLIAESLETVTYEDDRKCRVATGRWWAPHLGHHLGNPGHIDVDHHVPLKNAHLSGGWAWTPEEKERYANYLGEENHLVAISSRHNRSKGARGPEEWAPPDNGIWCDYALDWAVIKEKWELTMTQRESEIVVDMLGTCEDPPEYEVEIREAMEVSVGVHKPEPSEKTEGSVYGSCDDAESAGEERVLGGKAGGQGFPKAMVPSARDGDRDGVVCER